MPVIIYRRGDGMVAIGPMADLRREHARRGSRAIVFALLAAWCLLALCAGCSPPPRPPPVSGILADLDRIERGILAHEITVRDWRAAR